MIALAAAGCQRSPPRGGAVRTRGRVERAAQRPVGQQPRQQHAFVFGLSWPSARAWPITANTSDGAARYIARRTRRPGRYSARQPCRLALGDPQRFAQRAPAQRARTVMHQQATNAGMRGQQLPSSRATSASNPSSG